MILYLSEKKILQEILKFNGLLSYNQIYLINQIINQRNSFKAQYQNNNFISMNMARTISNYNY